MRTPLLKHWASRIMATLSLNLAATPTFAAPQSSCSCSSSSPFQSPSRLPLFSKCSRPRAIFMFATLASPSSSRLQASTKEGWDDAVVSLEESEEQRLQLDAEARNAMTAVAEAEADDQGNTPGAWKWAIRKRVWDVLEEEDLAQLPRPVHHRIPNFVGAGAAAAKLASLPAFQTARCVKVNPDTPQKQVRFLTLNGNKILMTPQPRLRTGFFSILEASSIPYIPDACTSAGVAKFGKPVRLDDKLKVDLIVIGSVAVDPKTGARLGKGEGFAELEYGMLRWMGAIDDSTLVVTTVHDRQLVDDIPVEKLLIHDVPVDIICTPTQIICTNTRIPKPQGIYWDKLSRQKLEQIRVLRDLKKRIEKETGQALPCAADEKLPPLAVRKRPLGGKIGKLRLNAFNHNTIFVWNVNPSTTNRQLQDHVAELGGDVQTVRTSLKPGNKMQMAWVMLKEGSDIGKIIEALDQSSLDGVTLRAKEDEPTRRAQDTSSPVRARK